MNAPPSIQSKQGTNKKTHPKARIVSFYFVMVVGVGPNGPAPPRA